MPNNIILSNIKKKLEAKIADEEQTKINNEIYLNDILHNFKEYFKDKLINNSFNITNFSNSYALTDVYKIIPIIPLNENDINYLKSHFKSELIELTGIDDIIVIFDSIGNRLTPKMFEFYININLNQLINQ